MLDSSRSVLQTYRGRGTRGLQQYFSPPEAAELVHKVFGDVAVVDLTAGDGALISRFPRSHRFGVELDPDYANSSNYTAIVGDIQKVYPLLRQVGFKADAIAINLPFGLQWSDSRYGEVNSTVLCYLYAVSLLSDYGQGVLVAGRDRFDREIMTRDEGSFFYAIIECDDLFTDADIPCVLGFFTKEPCHPHRWKVDRGELDGMAELWQTIQEEYDSRNKQQESRYSITRHGGKIAVRLSPYDQLALHQESMLPTVRSLHSQAITYFAINRREWTALLELEDGGSITIDPSLRDAVDEVLIEADRQVCPLYPIKPQQRLGFLEQVDSIQCHQDDPDRGYQKGKSYPVSAQSRVTSARYTETKLNNDGELVEVDKLKEWKVLKEAIDMPRRGRGKLGSAKDVEQESMAQEQREQEVSELRYGRFSATELEDLRKRIRASKAAFCRLLAVSRTSYYRYITEYGGIPPYSKRVRRRVLKIEAVLRHNDFRIKKLLYLFSIEPDSSHRRFLKDYGVREWEITSGYVSL